MGDNVWNNGQIILEIQNKMSVPSDSMLAKQISNVVIVKNFP